MSNLICSIIATGTTKHPRFFVADPQNRFWTGKKWSAEEAEGRLYVCVNTAGSAIQEILLAQYGGKSVRRFVAPVHLDLHSETELSLDQIVEWLVKVAKRLVLATAVNNQSAQSLYENIGWIRDDAFIHYNYELC